MPKQCKSPELNGIKTIEHSANVIVLLTHWTSDFKIVLEEWGKSGCKVGTQWVQQWWLLSGAPYACIVIIIVIIIKTSLFINQPSTLNHLNYHFHFETFTWQQAGKMLNPNREGGMVWSCLYNIPYGHPLVPRLRVILQHLTKRKKGNVPLLLSPFIWAFSS